ncbi:GNAT family N-acetyltransferase [Acidaminobacter hydrogenoformans]|uniref:Ribosomal-protein-alanine N-acetyltransferase n=1 Tax=Acidaminobacter hydrogenoformans DSM 2784 TaxID=1120920 RepID=A0A1G5RVN8_9FIRM|nr:GNAT family N-acetyltransferase [Acidaminobacter hydrogenoformans]SCZ78205.1 ribosomal-protein-alanine N-acetyltransferase [Acidaminobacter hydrogenoformans DSM 2784]
MFLMETERLGLRLLESADIEAIMTFWGNEVVMRYCGGAGSEERELRAVLYYQNLFLQRGFSVYGVQEKSLNRIIGACGFNPGERTDEAELIYHFAEAYWGKGYATEAAKACIEHLLGVNSINRLIASVDPRNTISASILEKLGFAYEGMKWHDDLKQEEPSYVMVLKEQL